MERTRRKMLASVGTDLTRLGHWRSQCHEIDRRSMSVAVIVSCNGWIDFQCVVLKVCGKIMREWLSWWSTTLPRLGSRVRVPSRALKNEKRISRNGYPFSYCSSPAELEHSRSTLRFGRCKANVYWTFCNCLQQENGEQG